MARKRFGVSPSINKALSQTIQMAEAENSNFISTEILVDRINLDPDNPRRHKITMSDLKNGPSNRDPHYKIKEDEYKGLCELSASIEKEGLLHPIVVYKDNEDFRLVAGERRFLATILAKKTIIDARVFKKKPKTFDLKVIQWMENESRKNLSLYNKLNNIHAIMETFKSDRGEEMTAIKLSEIICTSRPTAQFYVAILSNGILMKFIEAGKVSTLRKAIELSSIKTQEQMEEAIQLIAINKKMTPKSSAKNKSKGAGRKRQHIALGTTKMPLVAKVVVQSVLGNNQFNKYASEFSSTDWTCLDESTKAFQRLVKLLEKELGVTK